MVTLLDGEAQETASAKKLVSGKRELYDVLFLDCPLGISPLSENVLRAADAWMPMTLLPFLDGRSTQRPTP